MTSFSTRNGQRPVISSTQTQGDLNQLTQPRTHSIHKMAAMLPGALVAVLSTFAAKAQQNIFNVANTTITQSGHFFCQLQGNLASRCGDAALTVDYGLGREWEVGFNVYGARLYDRQSRFSEPVQNQDSEVAPTDLMLNLNKGLQVTDYLHSAIGTQVGRTIFVGNDTSSEFLNFNWNTNRFTVPNRPELGSWYLGAYYANQNFAGGTDTFNPTVGFEIPLFGHSHTSSIHTSDQSLSWHLVGDALFGHNQLSYMVVGAACTIHRDNSDWLQLSLGFRAPSPGSHNDYGIVVEFTLL